MIHALKQGNIQGQKFQQSLGFINEQHHSQSQGMVDYKLCHKCKDRFYIFRSE
jgi:hypothetical protein